MDHACEVPLVEQLRSVPEDYRTVRAIQWADDGRETGHQFIPVGFLMHRAAAEIERLQHDVSKAMANHSADLNGTPSPEAPETKAYYTGQGVYSYDHTGQRYCTDCSRKLVDDRNGQFDTFGGTICQWCGQSEPCPKHRSQPQERKE